MKLVRYCSGALALCALAAVVLLYAKTPVRGSELLNDPTVVANPFADITDAYLFPSPTNSSNVVAVMDVHPNIPAGTTNLFFNQKVLYQMKFITAYPSQSTKVENLVIQFSMSAVTNGAQQIYVYGPDTPATTGTRNQLLDGGTESAIGLINRPFSTSSGITVFAGLREDPSFEDVGQWYNILPDRNGGSTAQGCLPAPNGSGTCPQGFNSPGTDYFYHRNILSIVAEIPRTTLNPSGSASSVVAYWATSSTTSGQ